MTAPGTTGAKRTSAILYRLSLAAAAATVLAQILWVLVPDDARDSATVAAVVLFATATTTHAGATRGPAWAARYLLLALTVGWTAEAVGATTGLPFGHYDYAETLGPKVGPVPLVIPLAWLMMAYPALLAARRAASGPAARTCYAAALLTAWDLFLDPQMVAEGHWVWTSPATAVPGIPGIPAQNFAGWFLVGLVLFGLAAAWLPDTGMHDDRMPAAMLLWVYASNVLANAAFWGRLPVALIGGTVMGLILAPWLRSGVATRAFWARP